MFCMNVYCKFNLNIYFMLWKFVLLFNMGFLFKIKYLRFGIFWKIFKLLNECKLLKDKLMKWMFEFFRLLKMLFGIEFYLLWFNINFLIEWFILWRICVIILILSILLWEIWSLSRFVKFLKVFGLILNIILFFK